MYNKTHYSPFALIALFVLFFSLENCKCKNKNASNKFHKGLNLEQSEVVKNTFLLSSLLKNKKFRDIFTDKETQELNLAAEDSIFLEQDAEKGIYQIKVLPQKGISCGYHQIKNYAWLMKALNSDFKKFSNYYFPMLNEEIYEKYQKSTGCPSHESISKYKNIVIDKIKNKQVSCLPGGSKQYIEDFIAINFSKYGNSLGVEAIETNAKKILANVEDLAQTYIDKYAYAIATLYNNNALTKKLCDLNLKFLNEDKFIYGFDLNVWTCMDHAICLIINKDKENVEYILADSLNSNFKTAFGGSYLQAIETLKSFICQKGYFEKIF